MSLKLKNVNLKRLL